MDLSQQELPLTSYFAKGNKDSKPRVISRKKNKLTEEDSSSVARPSKRTKNDVRGPSRGPVPQESRLTPRQLPTPVASARKRIRGEKLADKAQLDSTDVLSPVGRPAQLEFGPRSPCPGAITGLPSTSLATPSTDWRKTTNTIERESSPGPPLSNHMESGIATPRTSSRRVSEPMHRIDCSPLANSSRPLPSKQNIVKRTDGQPSKGLPMFPVSSSQSQYLLPIDATPRKQRPQRIEQHVISSQTQEERELTLSSSLRPVTMFGLSIERSPGKNGPPGNAHTPRPGRRNSHHVPTLGYSPVGSPINTPSRSPRFFEKKKADELSSEPLGSPRRKISIPCHSPSRKTRTPRRITRQDSIENIPPVHIEESLTESESDPDVAQVPRRLPVSLDSCHPDNPPIKVDDSATEAESDTEILRCVAEIGKKRRRPEISREESPPAPVISPLVSPARSSIAPRPTQFSMRQGAESSVSGSSTSYQSTTEQPCTRSDSLPSVVRDFIRMFPGDESYPLDFPESLRV